MGVRVKVEIIIRVRVRVYVSVRVRNRGTPGSALGCKPVGVLSGSSTLGSGRT